MTQFRLIGEATRFGVVRQLTPAAIYWHDNMKSKSRIGMLPSMADASRGWGFLTNHARVLVCIADEPGVRLRDISERVGITERAAHRIVGELAGAGYITRERTGRRNTYVIHRELPLPDALVRNQKVGDLLAILTRLVPESSTVRDSATG